MLGVDCMEGYYEELLRSPPSLAPEPMTQAMTAQAEQAKLAALTNLSQALSQRLRNRNRNEG